MVRRLEMNNGNLNLKADEIEKVSGENSNSNRHFRKERHCQKVPGMKNLRDNHKRSWNCSGKGQKIIVSPTRKKLCRNKNKQIF